MTAAPVLCRCNHAERMHERDDGADSGRGVCMSRSCGCTEMRVARFEPGPEPDLELPGDEPDLRPVVEVDLPEPAAVDDVVEAEPAAEAPPELPWECKDCGERFPSPQYRSAHRRRNHPKTAPAPEQVVEVEVVEDDDRQQCRRCRDDVYAVSSRGWCDACEAEPAEEPAGSPNVPHVAEPVVSYAEYANTTASADDLEPDVGPDDPPALAEAPARTCSADVRLDFNGAGAVTIQVRDASADDLIGVLGVVLDLYGVTHGDPS